MATAAKAPASRDDLVSRARQCVDTFELPLALKFYERALDVAPDDCEVLDATGELLVRLGEPERAVPVLRRSIELQPNEGYAKYMNLGQFLSGAEALSCYEQGLALMDAHAEVLKARRAGSSKLSKKAARANDDELVELQQQMCAAHCAIAEVFLTDLCDEPDAEQRCESAVQHALSLGESSPAAQAEALQALANLRLTQSRREEARTALTQVASLTAAAVDSGDLAKLPTHEFRTTTGKLLLEAEMPDAACDVLEQLLLEDEDSAELRYLAALAAVRAEDREAAERHLEWRTTQLRERPSSECAQELHEWAESFDQVHELLRDAGSRTPADAKPAAGRSRDGDAASADMMETDN